MPSCHKCGKDVPLEIGTHRNIRTGAHTGSSGFFRTVTYCPRCDCQEEDAKDSRDLTGRRFMLAGVVAIVGIGVYLGLVYLGVISLLR